MKVMASTAIVTTRPWARSTAAMPPAWSIWLNTQPPKMSPLALVSFGMATRRTVSSPCGSRVGADDFTTVSSLLVPAPLIRLTRPRRQDALDAGNVPMERALDKAGARRDRKHAGRLANADFDHEPTSCGEQRRRRRRDRSIRLEPVGSAV